ncbi:basic amino acid ABC transporter substrate-binding protein [Crenobacter sp. SG2305]|uniref:basic amino acid ABC transporter substrate-binding protein n=1 Tax=Crenobacter oryzisoli TaxID=3056844 RepID=UPI0025AA7E90|nr:basic amino acid ABC transporter substrate-binding protein [Crenobacter sp. SG2305]MDN0082003.1 basic amino acid ABC transporter substrate-binding protein [Crenobacter sp. SG2305]
MVRSFSRSLLVGLLLAIVVLSGCGKKHEEPAAASGVKEYVVGTDAAYVPFEFQNNKDEVVGFTVDILNAVADKGGFKVRYVNTPWEGIFSTLEQGDRDIIASSVTITDERKHSMDFSEPYFVARQLIVIRQHSSRIRTFHDLKGKTVAVQVGTTGEKAMQKLLGKHNSHIKRFDSMPLALRSLESCGIDAAVGDNGVIQNYEKTHPSMLTIVDDRESLVPERYGFVVKKGNRELLDKINKGIKTIQSDGTYDTIYRKYFGNR